MPQQIDVPGTGIVEFPDGMDDAAITSAIQKHLGTATATPEKPFLEKLGNFARNVYNNPPPTVAAVRDVIKGAPAAATELTYGADPEAAREAAGTMLNAAALGVGFKGPGGTNVGVAGRPITAEGRAAPLFPPRTIPPPTTSEQAVEAAARGGYTVPAYLATEGTVIPQVASSVKNVPWAGQPITRTHDELLANMGRSKSDIVPTAGTPETAGGAAKTGLTSFIETGSKKPVSSAYEAVDAMINPDVRRPLDNTAKTVADIMGERAQARIPGQSEAVKRVMTAVQDPTGMDYAGTKMLRTWLGETTPQELIAQGIKPAEAKRLYGAMTKDLGNVVREAGGDEAFAAWHKANRLASLTMAQRNALTKIVGVKGEAPPEAVFERLATFANSKRGADINRLQLAKQAMGPAAWGEVGAATIDRLGMAPDGAFSPQRFVTAFGNMAPAARNQLFSGQQHAALQDLFLVSKHIGDRITRFGNPSGTARGGIVGSAVTGGAIFAEPMTVLTTLVGTRLAAEALSRPAVVRAATAVSRASLTGNPYAKQRAVAALLAMVQAEGLLPKRQDQQQLPRMQYGGRPTGPTVVGEDGPEVFVPDQPGTIVPGSPQDPFEAAAAKVRRRYPTREPDPASLAASQGRAATWEQFLPSEERARAASMAMARGEPADARDTFLSSLGIVGSPVAAPVREAGGMLLGAGAVRTARPAAKAISEAPRAPEVPMLLGNPELRGSMSMTENLPFTYRGKGPAEWTPQEFEEVGKHFGVDRLGPETPAQAFKYGDGGAFNIPGGLEGQFTYYDLLRMKADGIDPSRIPRDVHTQLQQKLMRSMDVDQPVSPERTWSGLMFGMTSPNNPLFPNQLTQSILRIREPGLRQQLAEAIPWKVGEKVSQEDRLAASDKIAAMLGINAASKGGLGVRGSTDYTRIAELAQMWEKHPQWFSKTDAESWPNYVERLSSQVTGTSMKTGSFGGVWQDPAHAGVSAIDRHMVNEFERTGKLFTSPAEKDAFEQRAVERWNNKEAKPVESYNQLPEGFLTKMKLEYVGNEQQVKLRTTKGEINPNVPPHLANVQWPSEPSHVKVMGDAYRRALDWNQTLATQHGLNLFPSQWLEWDRIRRRFEPHENMFPGLERMPAMSREQLRGVSAEHTASGHKTYNKTEGDEGQMNLQPTRPRPNPAPFAYFTMPPTGALPGSLMDLLQRNNQ